MSSIKITKNNIAAELIPQKPKVLSVKLIPDANADLLKSFEAKLNKGTSLGLITCDMDDALFVALDEATKSAQAEVIFAKSFYAGSSHSSGPLSGEAIGVFQAEDNQKIIDALTATQACLNKSAWFYQTSGKHKINFFPHVISSLGHYLSRESGLKVGDAMGYVIAPPMESIIGLDQALKAADVKLVKHFKPPTETNFGGGFLSGSLNEVQAAVEAFKEALVGLSEREFDLNLG